MVANKSLYNTQKGNVIAAFHLGLISKNEKTRLLAKICNIHARDTIEEVRKIRLGR